MAVGQVSAGGDVDLGVSVLSTVSCQVLGGGRVDRPFEAAHETTGIQRHGR